MEYISFRHVFVKEGIYYFSRRIPVDLRQHYSSGRISYSLRTRSRSIALSRANGAASKLDEYWYHLRTRNAELPGKHLLRHCLARQASLSEQGSLVTPDVLTLSDAVLTYLRLKWQGRPETFHRAGHRSCGYVIDVCGDKPLTDYTKADANKFRDALIKRGLAGSSITRIFGTVRAVFNFAVAEEGLSTTSPFANVYYDRNAGVSGRSSIPMLAPLHACVGSVAQGPETGERHRRGQKEEGSAHDLIGVQDTKHQSPAHSAGLWCYCRPHCAGTFVLSAIETP